MQRELAASGLSPEEILAKTLLLQKAMAGDNSPAFINKTLKNALNVANLNQEDLAKVRKTMIYVGILFYLMSWNLLCLRSQFRRRLVCKTTTGIIFPIRTQQQLHYKRIIESL